MVSFGFADTIAGMNYAAEQFLRSEQMGPLLAAAVRSTGLYLRSWSLERVYSRPHSATSARFGVDASGHPVTLIASTRPLTDTQRDQLGAVRCESPLAVLHIWAHPTDPELPGLQVVEDQEALSSRLSELMAVDLEVDQLQMLVLRPLRRAVYRVRLKSALDYRTVYLKIVRPHKVAELLDRHAGCDLTPATADLGDGIILLDEARGVPLTELLYHPVSPNPGITVEPEVILSALEGLNDKALLLPPRQAPAQRLEGFSAPLIAAGADAGVLEELIRDISAQLDEEPGERVAVHGDFHPANLFLSRDGRGVEALIDADTVGLGHRADDLAMMLAHLLALPSFDAEGYRGVADLVARLWARLVADGEAGDLPARTAGALISLAPGARSAEQLDFYLATAQRLVAIGDISATQHTPGQRM